jgi:hypothetical protein
VTHDVRSLPLGDGGGEAVGVESFRTGGQVQTADELVLLTE